MDLPEPIEKIKDMKNAKWIGLIVTLIVNVALMVGSLYMDPDTGYYVMMVGLVALTFMMLYIFGWRDGKQLAAAGIGMFILIGAIWGPMTVHRTYSLEEPEMVSSAAHINWFTKEYTELDHGIYVTGGVEYALDEGTLTPYKGDVGQQYNFTIILYSNGTFDEPPQVMVAYALGVQGTIAKPMMVEAEPNDTNYVDGKEFYYTATIQDAGIYSHVFSVNFEGSQPHSLNTTVALGPLVGDESASYGFYAMVGIPSMFCNIGMLFVIIVLLYWWIGTAKEKRQSWDLDIQKKEEELKKELDDEDLESLKPFTCDQCGAGVGAEDNFCPKCGERFDEVEE